MLPHLRQSRLDYEVLSLWQPSGPGGTLSLVAGSNEATQLDISVADASILCIFDPPPMEGEL
jgi:hypothetical protein